ncbi:MAG: hypothetical protein CL674_03215 [Bdellovibrionaceae bacterium]|nr:hypothetical protein [Pseudobdellovibrionaceae bacterium]
MFQQQSPLIKCLVIPTYSARRSQVLQLLFEDQMIFFYFILANGQEIKSFCLFQNSLSKVFGFSSLN